MQIDRLLAAAGKDAAGRRRAGIARLVIEREIPIRPELEYHAAADAEEWYHRAVLAQIGVAARFIERDADTAVEIGMQVQSGAEIIAEIIANVPFQL